MFTGPMVIYPEDRINPYRKVKWNDLGLLEYEMIPGAHVPNDEGEEGAAEE